MTSSRLDTPGLNPDQPIPNAPFYSPETEYIQGAYSPVIIGEGLTIDGDYLETTSTPTPSVSITENTTFYVAVDGSDVDGDGSQTNPWATPHKAMSVLSHYIIWEDAQVIIQCSAGEYTFNTPLNIDHPYGKQIVIQGEVTGPRPSIGTLTSAGYGYNPTARAHNLSVLSGVYETVFSCNACNGVEAFNVSGVTLNDILIAAATQTENTAGICAGIVLGKVTGYSPSYRGLPSTATIRLGNVAVFGFEMAGVLAVGGTVTFDPNSGIVCSCNDNDGFFGGGLMALSNGVISSADIIAVNNQWGWAAAEGGAIPGYGFANGNQNGIYVAVGGLADITNGNAANNIDTVFKVANGGIIRAQNVNSITLSAGNLAEVNGAGFIDLVGAALHPSAVLDPPADTIGNGLGYIRTV
jgi:hypothetical protein